MAPRRKNKLCKEIQPLKPDRTVTFSSVGGLENHIKCLREMVLFPLIYPDFFKRFDTRPPKGVLFHGPPGTGKTLLARALANECSLVRGRKVAFFMRKGADVMSKWYGESEKYIKTIFQQASKMRPSIIFFDEIDSLAPVRTEGQNEMFASVVATLLVEMDGLWDRGDVIVIGATNRPDCLDPALRRPGRLDRELFFPPPSLLARRDILAINTQHWLPRPSDEILDLMAQTTNGFLGSDLSALCSEAVLSALRRVYPQVYEGDYQCLTSIDTRKVEVKMEDMISAKNAMLPAGARYSTMVARHLPPHYEPLIGAQVQAVGEMLKQAFPPTAPGQGDVSTPSVFLICGESAELHLAPALLAQLEYCNTQELSMATLHSGHAYSQERAILSIFSECRRTDRGAVIFIPNVTDVWEALAKCAGQALLLQQWRTRAAGDKALLLATCNVLHEKLPDQLQELFPAYKNCVYYVRNPTPAELLRFFLPVVEKVPTLVPVFEDIPSSVPETPTSNELSQSAIEVAPREARQVRKRRCMESVKGPDHKRSKHTKEAAEAEDESYEKREDRPLDLGRILQKNADILCRLGFKALTDLYAQLNNAISSSFSIRERMQLPLKLRAIIGRYLILARNTK